MTAYVIRRLLQIIPVLIVVSMIAYGLIHIAPGNPALHIAGPDASEDVIREIESQLGLDRPVYEQYFSWVSRAVQGDLGVSLRTRVPVTQEIFQYLPNSLALGVGSLVLSVIIGVIMGITAALKQNSLVDNGIMFMAVSGISAPSFVRGVAVMWVFAITLGWFPISGGPPGGDLLSAEGLRHMMLPMVALSIGPLATLGRMGRSSMLEVLGQDYIRTAQAKGLSQRVVLYKHALRNALLPVVTVIGFQVGAMFGGTIVTETIFAWPGVGRRIVGAISARDFPVVQAAVLLLAFVFIVANLLVDIAYVFIDPRIRYD